MEESGAEAARRQYEQLLDGFSSALVLSEATRAMLGWVVHDYMVLLDESGILDLANSFLMRRLSGPEEWAVRRTAKISDVVGLSVALKCSEGALSLTVEVLATGEPIAWAVADADGTYTLCRPTEEDRFCSRTEALDALVEAAKEAIQGAALAGSVPDGIPDSW